MIKKETDNGLYYNDGDIHDNGDNINNENDIVRNTKRCLSTKGPYLKPIDIGIDGFRNIGNIEAKSGILKHLRETGSSISKYYRW